jgi:hypothetical protein
MSEPFSSMNRRRFGRRVATGVAGLWGLTANSARGEVEEAALPSSVHLVTSVSDMKGLDPSEHRLLYVRGYHQPGDGGGGLFEWVSGFEREPDGGITFASEVDSYGPGEVEEGRWVRQWKRERVNVRWFGVRADLDWAREVSIASGSRLATAQTSSFNSGDAGKSFVLNGTEGQVVATIRRVRDASTVELDREAPYSVDNMVASWGTDDAPAFNRAIAFANPDPVQGGELVTHQEVPSYGIFVPDGDYLIATPIVLREGTTLIGASTMGTRLNLSFAEDGGDHWIRSYFHSNKSAIDTGSHAEHQKNFGLERLGLRPRPGERNPGENQKFVYIKFGIEFSVENVRISMHNSPFKGAPWHVVGVQLEKNVDPDFDQVNFEGGQIGLYLVQPSEEIRATDRFGVRGGMFSNLYFYNQKRWSCVAEHVYNSRFVDVTCKYAQSYGYEDRTAFKIGPGQDGSPSQDIQLDAIFVNGYRASAKLGYGMVLQGDRLQVTGGSIRHTNREGIVIEDGDGAIVNGTSVGFSGGHGVEVKQGVTEAIISSVTVKSIQGHGIHVDGNALLATISGRDTDRGLVGGDGHISNTEGGNTGAPPKSGISSERPSDPSVGMEYFDTDLQQPIWLSGDRWVDASGRSMQD